jgi:competence protein ComEC
MFNGKLFRDISTHPFLFLIVLGAMAIALLVGYFLLTGRGMATAFQPTATPEPSATLVPTATVTSPPPAPTTTATRAPTAAPLPLVVTFIDVEKGESILIQAPEGQTALIDGGAANGQALAYLREQGIKSIDIMIATLPHEEHYGGLVEVLDAMPVRTVITNPQSDDTSALYRHFLDAIATAGADYLEVKQGDSIHLGSLVFSVLNPNVIKPGNLNTNSLVLELTHRKTTFLFMGDADRYAENAILATRLNLHADILKLGQHGSCDSSDPAFLDAVHPSVAVYFTGLYYPFMNPCPGTVSALKEDGTFVYGTDEFGSISVTVSMDGYSIRDSTGVIFRK